MSIGLAINRIAQYSSRLEQETQYHDDLERRILVFTAQGKDPPPTLRAEIARSGALISLFKEFLDFWKNIIKQELEIIKSLQELAFGAR